MNLKKILAAASATALASTVGVAAVASAAVSFDISLEPQAAMPGEQVVVTASEECSAAEGRLVLLIEGLAEPDNTAYSGNTITYTVAENNAGLVVALSANCLDAQGEPLGTSNEVALNVFGAGWVVSDPELFTMGDPVTITAGDFAPGAEVTLTLTDEGGTQRFTDFLGTADDSFTVSGSVIFPADLEPGDYVMAVTDGTYSTDVILTVHPQDEEPTPEPEPTEPPTAEPDPTTSPTPEPSPSPTASPTPAPAQPGPGTAPAPGRSVAPGLPATGD